MAVDEDLLYQLIGERIRRARQSTPLSQARVAKKLGMSRASIVNIEAGRQRAPVHVLWQIAELLGTEVRLLIPAQADYQQNGEPLRLDPDVIRKIEEAANGDPTTRRDLTRFIAQATASTEENK